MNSIAKIGQNYQKFEDEHVHNVYDKIAPHFDQTRYKPWPVVKDFLQGLPKGSLVLDVGCGNGKYLKVNENVVAIGVDRCCNLVSICNRKKNNFVAVCDNLNLMIKDNAVDHVICIAVIHHFSTKERRLRALKELFRTVRKGGDVLVFVWAIEQQAKSNRKVVDPTAQDVFVSWKTIENNDQRKKEEFSRYYHLFKEGELEELFNDTAIPIEIVAKGYDADNWYVLARKL